jgi:hypothetical protein
LPAGDLSVAGEAGMVTTTTPCSLVGSLDHQVAARSELRRQQLRIQTMGMDASGENLRFSECHACILNAKTHARRGTYSSVAAQNE